MKLTTTEIEDLKAKYELKDGRLWSKPRQIMIAMPDCPPKRKNVGGVFMIRHPHGKSTRYHVSIGGRKRLVRSEIIEAAFQAQIASCTKI